jgi:glycosyltransferase involved in cell wall biosynthesis
MLTQLSDYRIITTMHSVFYHPDKTIIEAAMPEIIVHLEGAKTVLEEHKKLSSKIYVIPHGCFPCIDKSKLWNIYKSAHTFIQFGFLLRYKGFENSIKAVAILKEKYPDIFFTILASDSSYGKFEHQLYYNDLMQLISFLKLEDNVGIVRGFQSETVLDAYLRTNKVAVFPYAYGEGHECFGVSGAAPYAMTKNIPVISSSINHFKHLPTIKADSSDEIAQALDILFSDDKALSKQIERQSNYLNENSWNIISQKYIDVFEHEKLL